MPEYSSTTITPADGVQVPSMNGSTSGNFLLSALRDYILASKGQANGLASLGSDGKLTLSQLPDLADDVIVVASYAVLPATGTAGKIYITADNNKMYRWDSDLSTPDYVELSVDLSEYAKLTDLAAEETARETADANLNDAIAQHEARIENLEQKAGDYSVTQYRGSNAVPTGKAKNALVESIVGKTRGWNQLVDPTNLRTRESYNVSITNNNNGSITIATDGTALASTNLDITTNNFGIAGHKYLLFGGKTGHSLVINDGNSFGIDSGSGVIFTAQASIKLQFPIANGQTYNATLYPCVRDLTLIFGSGNEPSTVAEAVSICPDLLKYDSYGYSLVDTEVEGVESKGFNLCDEIFKQGRYSPENGAYISGTNRLCSENYIPVMPSTTYYFYMGYADSSKMFSNVCWYDDNNNFISAEMNFANTTKTSPPNASKALLSITPEYGTTYKHDICINISSSLNGTYKPYVAPSTLTLSTTVELKSAGSVSEVLDVETGYKTRPLGSVDLSTLSFVLSAGRWRVSFSGAKWVDNNTVCNLTSAYYLADTASRVYANESLNTIAIEDGDKISVYNGSTTTPPTGILYYELATPDPDQSVCDPIIDNTLPTEGGGTIETMQTQTPVIDNSLDVGYLAV